MAEIEVRLTVNNRVLKQTVSEDMTLLRFLRDRLRLTGTKCGCSAGECGACTVLVNGEAKKSCLIRMNKLHDAKVETIENLSVSDLHPLQKAFIRTGAIQCGFCTPGMIMAAKALLDRNISPSRKDILSALSGNLCRCTGYFPIIEAVEEASRILSGQETHEIHVQVDTGPGMIGVSVPEKSDILKATGRLVFSDDLYFDGICFGAVLFSDS